MKKNRIISFIMAASILPVAMPNISNAQELYNKVVDMTNEKPDGENGILKEFEVPDGDYTVTVTTGGKTETKANIYINGGERVRAYTLEAGKTQENEQPVIPLDGKITVQVLGSNPNVTEIEIQQLESRTKNEHPTIYIAGDSTAQTYDYTKVFPQTGWGQMFEENFKPELKIENRSMGGRSSKSYNNDGRLDKILTQMHPGDYVFIQFGINDGAQNKPERYISVEDYKDLITNKYIGEVKKHGGIPVLLTATAAAWWDEETKSFKESRQDYAVPTIEIAKETNTALIDINKILTDEWNSMNMESVLDGYFICEPLESKAYPNGTDDHTHLKELGAKRIASLIAESIPEVLPELEKYLREDDIFLDVEGHWAKDIINSMASDGYVKGVGENKFNPDGAVTRAEFLKMAMNVTGVKAHAYREAECLDASNGDWYCYYLQGALDKDIIPERMIENCEVTPTEKVIAEATENSEKVTVDVNIYTGRFNGNVAITRSEMAEIAVNCISKTNENSIDDYKSYAIENGLMIGRDDNDYAWDETLTRAEAITIVSRIANMER